MTHTVETLMALAFSYAYKYADTCEVEQDCPGLRTARTVLRAALTEALAQPIKPIAQRVQDLVERLGGIEYLESRSAQPVREPLTQNEIYELFRQHLYVSDVDQYSIHGAWEFARAIERAHGIGGDK